MTRPALVAGLIVWAPFISCAPRLVVRSMVVEPEEVEVTIQAPTCAPLGRIPDELEVTTDPYERVRGCFSIDLDGQPPCEWGCATTKGGPCGNGPVYDMLVVMHTTGGASKRSGRIALADHGPNPLSFRRTLRVEKAEGRLTLFADMDVPGMPTRSATERYVLVGDDLVELKTRR